MEKRNCLIHNPPANVTWKSENNLKDTILLPSEFKKSGFRILEEKKDETIKVVHDLPYYFNQSKTFDTSLTDSLYAYSRNEYVSCQLYEDYDKKYVYMALLIPVIYVLVFGIALFIYCRYRKVRSQYTMLREERPSTEPDQNENKVNQKLELASSNNMNYSSAMDKHNQI
jgi:hypothetical protein